MFSYKLPKWNIKINTKALSIALTVVFILSTLPLLVLSHYNWPSADDLSLALKTHQYYQSTGSLIGTFFYAFKVGFDEYMHWMGYYFSNVVFCYSPHLVDEKWHFLVGYEMIAILTLGVCYFFNALFVKAFKADKHLSNIFSMITLITIIQSMEEGTTRVEAFYWYSGAINYMFMLGLALFWLGLMIRIVYDEKKSSRIGKMVFACFWGFWLGGANYMTALEIAICSVLIIVIVVMTRLGRFTIENVTEEGRKYFNLLWIPSAINLIGFAASCLSPGNATREAQVQGFGAIKSILIGLYYTYSYCINTWTRWEVIVAFVILIPVSYKLAGSIRHRFEHPFIFAVFAYGMVSANMVPPLFAVGSMEAGRLRSITWVEYVMLMALTIFYFTAWARQIIQEKRGADSMDKDPGQFSANMSMVIATCILFLAFGSGLCVHVDPYYYAATSATYDIATGTAADFLEENKERLAVLKDESVTDPVFKPYEAKPEMLVFFDITEDPEYWINRATASYYEKNSVILSKD